MKPESSNTPKQVLDRELSSQINYRLIESLRASERRYRDLVERLHDVVFHIDDEGKLGFLNNAWKLLLGKEIEDCLGTPLESYVHSLDRARFASAVQLGQFDETHTTHGDVRFVAADGSIRWFILVVGEEAQDGGLVGSLRDVTAAREAEHQRASFVASVSHELRTPLTSILGFSQALQRDGDLPKSDKQRFLSIITDQALRLKGLVDGLLDLTRIHSGEFGCCLEPIALRPFLRNYADSFCSVAEADGIQFVDEIEIEEGSEISFELDAGRFTMALDNLLGNAVKFSEDGGEVRLVASIDAEGLAIQIQDDGLGIPPEHIDRVFERFFRVPRPGHEIPGTGFGLFIAREIVEAHGGSISVRSESGIGSTFGIHIPFPKPSTKREGLAQHRLN